MLGITTHPYLISMSHCTNVKTTQSFNQDNLFFDVDNLEQIIKFSFSAILILKLKVLKLKLGLASLDFERPG